MIKNLWERIQLYCDNGHSEPVKMEIQDGPMSLFYACPKYHPQNRKENEKACANRINLVDYQKIVESISEKLEQAELNNEVVRLDGLKWNFKSISCEVMSHKDHKIKILMLNKKSLK